MKQITKMTVLAAGIIGAASCSSHRQTAPAQPESGNSVAEAVAVSRPGGAPQPLVSGVVMDMPSAVVYRTSVDCSNLVPVGVENGKLTYFPAVTDITDESAPLPLADGFWLSRCGGIGANTRFTNWTFEQYMALKQTPSPSEILANLSDARVVEIKTLDNMTPWQAEADTAAVNAIIRSSVIAPPTLSK